MSVAAGTPVVVTGQPVADPGSVIPIVASQPVTVTGIDTSQEATSTSRTEATARNASAFTWFTLTSSRPRRRRRSKQGQASICLVVFTVAVVAAVVRQITRSSPASMTSQPPPPSSPTLPVSSCACRVFGWTETGSCASNMRDQGRCDRATDDQGFMCYVVSDGLCATSASSCSDGGPNWRTSGKSWPIASWPHRYAGCLPPLPPPPPAAPPV